MTVRRTILVLALVAAAVLGATRWIAMPWVVVGPSMAPALADGDRVLVDLWSYRRRGPRPGEIVLFRGPGDVPLVKRVVDGPLPPARRAGPLVDPTRPHEPAYWLLGDHAAISVDSRRFGPVPRERIRGRVLVRYWPPSRAGRI